MLDDSTVGSCGFEIEVKLHGIQCHDTSKRATRIISVALFVFITFLKNKNPRIRQFKGLISFMGLDYLKSFNYLGKFLSLHIFDSFEKIQFISLPP